MTIEECTSIVDWFLVHGDNSMPDGGFKQIAENRRRLGLDQVARPAIGGIATISTRDETFLAEIATIDKARALGVSPQAAVEFAHAHPRATDAELEAAADELVFERWARGAAARIYAPPRREPSAPRSVERPLIPGAGPRTHVLRYQPRSPKISLSVTLNDRVTCSFEADTGSAKNTMPRWAADKLGIEINAGTPRVSIVGITGNPMMVPVVKIASLRAGTVFAENVEMEVLDTMSTGLLGLEFLNRFRVAIDSVAGELRLTEIDAAADDLQFESWARETAARIYAKPAATAAEG